MKNLFTLFLFMSIIVHALPAAQSDFTHEEKNWIKAHPSITFAVSSKNPPHSFIDNDSEVKGIQIDFIDLIAQKTGLTIQKEVSVWPKTLENAMAHKVDGIVDLAKREEREKALNFTDVYLKAPFALISTEDYPNIQDLNQFCGKKIAITFGTSAAQFLQKEYPCIELVDTHTENMVEKVMKKEVDAFFERYEVFLFHDKQALFSGLKVMYYKFIPPSGFSRLGVRNDAPLLLSILNKAIQSVTMEEQNKITSKWVGSTFPSYSEHDKVSLTPQEKNYLVTKQTITMCANPDMLPFEHIDVDGKYKGISSDIVQLISKDIDTSIELIPTKSWIETLEKFNHKECDMIPMAINTPNRQKMMNFTQSYINEPTVIATKDDTFFIQDSSALKHKKIGVINGYAFVELLQQKHPSIEIVTVDSSLDGLKRVQKGELFGYVDALSTIAYTLQKNALLDLKIAGRLEFDVTISMALQKEDPLLRTIMQKALDNIEKEQIDSIVGKWISIKVEQSFDYRVLLYVVIIFSIIIFFILQRHFTLKKMNKQLEKLSITDNLTKLYNRNKLDEVLILESYRANRFSYSFGIIIIDIDHFKSINDTYGHLVGDTFLKEISEILTNHSRKIDTVGRWGGEEFLIICGETDERGMKMVAEKLREAIANYSFSLGIQKTASFGISVYQKNDTIDAMIKRADDALYEAKKLGRNRVCLRL